MGNCAVFNLDLCFERGDTWMHSARRTTLDDCWSISNILQCYCLGISVDFRVDAGSEHFSVLLNSFQEQTHESKPGIPVLKRAKSASVRTHSF